MGDIGTPMTSPDVPTVGTAGTGYATTIYNFLQEVKQRLQAKVPLSSILVSALDMTNNAIQNLSYASLYPQSSTPSTPSYSLQGYLGDLYWVSPSGAVKITSGTSLNSAGIGGITGDYGGANPAQLRFVDADTEYYAYDDFAGGLWAYFKARAFDIAGAASGSPRARLTWAGSSSYTVTLPAAVPASQALVQMSTGGVLSASNTLAETVTFSDVKLTADHVRVIPTSSYQSMAASGLARGTHRLYNFNADAGLGATWLMPAASSTDVLFIPLTGFNTGDRIKEVTVRAGKVSDATNELKMRVLKADNGTLTSVGEANNSAAAPGAIALTVSALTQDVSANMFWLEVTQSDSSPSAQDFIYEAEVTWTRP